MARSSHLQRERKKSACDHAEIVSFSILSALAAVSPPMLLAPIPAELGPGARLTVDLSFSDAGILGEQAGQSHVLHFRRRAEGRQSPAEGDTNSAGRAHESVGGT